INGISRAAAAARPTLAGKMNSRGSQWRSRAAVVLEQPKMGGRKEEEAAVGSHCRFHLVAAIEEEDDDGSGSDVSKAFMVMSLRQDGRCKEERDVVSNVGKAACICYVRYRKGCSVYVEKTEVDRLQQVLGSPTP
ncbi:hypothetical protein B296_00025872, partial [Ensete ventricosum]